MISQLRLLTIYLPIHMNLYCLQK